MTNSLPKPEEVGLHTDALDDYETVYPCRIEMVDGSPVRVQGAAKWSEQDRAAFEEVVRAARRKHRRDNCLKQPGCDDNSHALTCNETYYGTDWGE